MQHVEQNPDRSRFVMGQCLINSRRHVTEIQLSRRREPPRLRLLLEFSGRGEQPEQQHRPEPPHREAGVRGRRLSGSCLCARREIKKKCPGGWSSFLSPAARAETRLQHRSPRSQARWRTHTGRSPPSCRLFDAFGAAEVSARSVCAPASARSGRSCVAGTRGGARRRCIHGGSTGPRGNTPPTGGRWMEGGEEEQLEFHLI